MNIIRYLLLLIACFLTLQSASARIWTSQFEKTIEADFVSLDESVSPAIITLRVTDGGNGRLFSFPLDQLSQSDQDFARSLNLLMPALSIRITGGLVFISWDISNRDDLTLHYSDTLRGSWLPVTSSSEDEGTTRTVTLPLSDAPRRFFRLEE